MAPRLNRKIIEKYFDFVNDKAVCKQCSQTLKTDRIFNLKSHVLKVHKIKEEEFSRKEKKVGDIVKTLSKKYLRKQAIKTEISKQKLFRSYIGLVTEDSIPFHVLDSENFKNIIDPICHGLSITYKRKFYLNSSNCKQILKAVANNIKDAITTELKQQLLSLKIHNATRLSRSLYGISVQFIKNNEIQARILGMVELNSSDANSSKNLATEILNTLTKYDIHLSQIVSITMDNGANIINTNEDCYEGPDNDGENEIYLKNIQMFTEFSEIHLGNIEICRCAADTAQLCVLDVTSDTEITTFILNCRKLVKFVQNPSNGYLKIFELKNLTLPQLDCPTSWGSTYNMVTSLKNAKEVLFKTEPIKNEFIDENVELNDNFWDTTFWDFLEAYCIVFEPLHHKINKFQMEQLHYGNFYAEWLKCKLCTEKILANFANDNKMYIYVEKMVIKLLNSIEERTKILLSNDKLISCLYLDPRFHHTLTLVQKHDAATYLKKLHEKIRNLKIHAEQNKSSTESLSSSLETRHFSQKADEYLNEYLTRNFVPTSKESIDAYTKIVNLQLPFLPADSNVLQFWKDKQYSDPELYALSEICFAVPTQVTIGECAFSSLETTLINNQNQITHEILENILLVKLNAEFLHQAIEDLPLFEDDEDSAD